MNVLCLYRHYHTEKRGTALRVKSLVSGLSKHESFNVFTASKDKNLPYGSAHNVMTGSHAKDLLALNKFISKHDIQVVVCHTLSAAYFLVPLKILNPRKKFVLEMHGFLEEEAYLYGDISKLKYYRNKLLYAIIYCFADRITACSETASEILSRYNKKVTTIYGGVDLNLFNPDVKPDPKYVSEENKIVIGYSGNARKWQGLEYLIDAFEELRKDNKNFHLYLLLSEDIDLGDRLNVSTFSAVPHNQVAHFNAACDILIIPRPNTTVNKISFPSKLMEYMAMGKPVVSSTTSDVHRIIKHGENGMLYEPGDVGGMVKCFVQLTDKKIRDKIGEHAFKTAKNSFTWQKQVNMLAEVVLSTKSN